MDLDGSANLHQAQRSQLGVVIECNQRAGHLGASSSRLPLLTWSLILQQASTGLVNLREREQKSARLP